jgi:hypothetical protein
MLKRLILTSVVLLPLLSGAANADATIAGAGAVSCGTWLAGRADYGRGGHYLMLNWALGYISHG